MPPKEAPLLRAARREPVPYTPVWLMRQAGRYLPEYRAMRERFGFLELCRNPEAAAEVTLQPVERLGVDAAILFADILLILEPLGRDPPPARDELEEGPDLVRRRRPAEGDEQDGVQVHRRSDSSWTMSTSARACATGVSWWTPWPRLKMCPGRPPARASTSLTRSRM